MKKLVLLMCVLMTGCAAKVISSNERSVVVKAYGSDAMVQAQKLADAECAKVNRFARFNQPMQGFVFDCVQ